MNNIVPDVTLPTNDYNAEDGIDIPDGHYIDWEGDEVYVTDGEYHRDDGPAIIYRHGGWLWAQHGDAHRADGPAQLLDGEYCWAFDGNYSDFDDYLVDAGWTASQIVEWKLQHG